MPMDCNQCKIREGIYRDCACIMCKEAWQQRGENDAAAIVEEHRRRHDGHYEDFSIRIIQCEHAIEAIKANDEEARP